MTTLSITRRPIVLETQASGAMLTEMVSRVEAITGRAALYGITDPVAAKLFGQESVEADFEGGYYRNGYVVAAAPSLLDGWTTTRTGAGTALTSGGAVVAFATGVPRITDKGYLSEAAATNLLSYSQDFSNGAWQKIAGGTGVAPSVTANAALAPDGTMTADEVVFTLGVNSPGDNYSLLYRDIGVTVVPHGRSVWMRSATPCQILVRSASGASYTVCSVDQAWRRFEGAATPVGTTISSQIGLRSGEGSSASATVHVWQGQMEAGPGATSDIPTTTASATRGVDNAYFNAALPGAWTAMVEFDLPSYSSVGQTALALTSGAGHEAQIYRAPGGLLTLATVVASNTVWASSVSMTGARTRVRAALSWDGLTHRSAVNGTSLVGTTALPGSPAVNLCRVGQNLSSDGPLSSYVRRLMLRPRGATAAELEAMTA